MIFKNFKGYFFIRIQNCAAFNLRSSLALAAFILVSTGSHAQQQSSEPLFTVYRPKLVEFDLENIYQYNTSSISEQFGKAKTQVETDRLFKLKVGIPVIIRKDRKFGLQLKYSKQRFNLDTNDPSMDYELYDHLNGETFKALALRFLYEKNIADNKKITIAGGSEIRSDRLEWNKNSTKHFISASYGVKLNNRTDIGFGFAVSYSLGLQQFYPLFNYSRKLTPKWTMDLTLPKSASLRYMVNEKLYVIARTQVKGWRYNLNNPLGTDLEQASLRKADLLSSVIIEKEIHDWLWVGAEFGLINNLRYYLAEPGDRARDAIIDLQSNDATFFKASIFLVPPKKFYDKK